jgi:outer membrane protein TolC
VRQSEIRRQQAQLALSAAQRTLLAELKTFYSEADAARAELDTLRQSADLAAESVRLTNLRYQAGEATALEVVDAQNTLVTARSNYDDGEARYRLAIANLQTLTGIF